MPTIEKQKGVLRKPFSVSPFLCTLPVELLARIFQVVQFSLGVPDNELLPYPAWLPITHVCRYWRTVALSHAQLWTSIAPGLSLFWINVFVERSRTMLMDFNLFVHLLVLVRPPGRPDTRHRLAFKDTIDIIQLFEGFTRVRSLCLTGTTGAITPIIHSLRHSLPIQSFSLCINGAELVLPDDLFGGKAPIRCLQFIADCHTHVVAPGWLFHGVSHFTTRMSFTPSEFLNKLCPVSQPTLTHLEFWEPPSMLYGDSGMDNLPASPIHMPQLVNLIVRAHVPSSFIMLNRLLHTHVDAKRRLELCMSTESEHWMFCKPLDAYQIDCLSQIVTAANGFRHIQISGTRANKGWCRLWTGDAVTFWEDAKFCLSFGLFYFQDKSLEHFYTMCDALGAAQVHTLVIDSPYPGLRMSSWWKLLEILPGVEELELSSASVDTLGDAWTVSLAPAVLPALRKVRIVDSTSPASTQQYAILGDPPARKIVRLPSYAEDDVELSPDLESAEKELEDMSKGLLRLLRGLGRKFPLNKRGRRKGKMG